MPGMLIWFYSNEIVNGKYISLQQLENTLHIRLWFRFWYFQPRISRGFKLADKEQIWIVKYFPANNFLPLVVLSARRIWNCREQLYKMTRSKYKLLTPGRKCHRREISELDQVYCAWLRNGLYACMYWKRWRFGRVSHTAPESVKRVKSSAQILGKSFFWR